MPSDGADVGGPLRVGEHPIGWAVAFVGFCGYGTGYGRVEILLPTLLGVS